MTLQRVKWRGITTDKDSAESLEYLATDLSGDVLITPGQGSYTSSTDASADTHEGAGAVDIWCTPTTGPKIERWLRSIGWAAWYRPAKAGVWRDHVHALRIDCQELSRGAKLQVGDYLAGYNGLPMGGRINKDTGSREYLDVRWLIYKETVMSLSAEDKTFITSAIERGVWGRDMPHPVTEGEKADAWQMMYWAARYSLLGLQKLGSTDFVDEKAIVASIVPAIAPALAAAINDVIEPVPGEVNADALAEAVLAKLTERLTNG